MAVALAVLVTVGGLYYFGAFSTEVRVEPVAYTDAEPFTAPVGDGTDLTSADSTTEASPAASAAGNTPGLYGGTNRNACDADALVEFLEADPAKAAAWAEVHGIAASDIREYVASLVPVVLRSDTTVVNHGYRNGRATTVNSVLQAGTAVLVDDKGVPRVRCKCGNPLLEGKKYSRTSYSGQTWTGFSADRVTQVTGSAQRIDTFTVVNVQTGKRQTVTTPPPFTSTTTAAAPSSTATRSSSASTSVAPGGSGTSGDIDGTYALQLATDTCQVNGGSCTAAGARTWTVSCTSATECTVEGQTFRRNGNTLTRSIPARQSAFTCNGQPVPTTITSRLTISSSGSVSGSQDITGGAVPPSCPDDFVDSVSISGSKQ